MRRPPFRVLLAAAVVGVVLALSVIPVTSTFKVQADTQIITLDLADAHRDVWFFTGAKLYQGRENSPLLDGSSFDGTVRVLPTTTVTITRIGNGKLRVTCKSKAADAVVAEITTSANNAIEKIKGRLAIVAAEPNVKDGAEHPTVLSYYGKVKLGAQVSDASGEYPALLQQGSISVIARTLIGNIRYEAGSAALGLADFVDSNGAADAFGILSVDQSADMTTAFRVQAKSMSIQRIGALGESVYATPLARIKSDPVLQGIWAASVFLIGFLWKVNEKPAGRK